MAQGTGARLPQESRRTVRIQELDTPGISIGEWKDDRRKKYWIRYGADRSLESFVLESDRNDFAENLIQAAKIEGQAVLSFDPAEWRDWLAFKKETGATLAAVRQLWGHAGHKANLGLTVEEAVRQFHELRVKENLGADSVRHAKTILRRFAESFGLRQLVTLTTGEIASWLDSMAKAHGLGDIAKREHRKFVSVLYERAILEKWAVENPVKAVHVPDTATADDIPALTLEQAFQLFQANHGQRIIGRLALEAFGGLRCSSAVRLQPSEIDYENHGITFPAAKHKLGKRYYVDGLPANLFEWLRVASADGWKVGQSNYNRLKSEAFARAGLRNDGNVLRHSFTTYHVAAYRNAGLTATLLTHRNATMLYQHYRGKGVSQVQGLLYFQITPETVKLTFQQFQSICKHPPASLPPSSPKSPASLAS